MSNTDERDRGPDQGPYVLIEFQREFRTIPEVTEALTSLDNAWLLASRLVRVDTFMATLDDEIGARHEDKPNGAKAVRPSAARVVDVQTQQVQRLRDLINTDLAGARPEVKLSLQSPLLVELNELAAEAWALKDWAVGGGLSFATWRMFKFFLNNAESIGGFPHRFRTGWHQGRASADDAATAAALARWRRETMELELELATQIDDVGRAVRALGPLNIDSNFPDEPQP